MACLHPSRALRRKLGCFTPELGVKQRYASEKGEETSKFGHTPQRYAIEKREELRA
jgi:hypothetical protein